MAEVGPLLLQFIRSRLQNAFGFLLEAFYFMSEIHLEALKFPTEGRPIAIRQDNSIILDIVLTRIRTHNPTYGSSHCLTLI